MVLFPSLNKVAHSLVVMQGRNNEIINNNPRWEYTRENKTSLFYVVLGYDALPVYVFSLPMLIVFHDSYSNSKGAWRKIKTPPPPMFSTCHAHRMQIKTERHLKLS